MTRHIVEWLYLTFPAPPSANSTTRNVPRRGRVKTKAYIDWIKEAGYTIAAGSPGRVIGPYHLEIRVRRASLRRDLGNYEKPISDLLVSMGIVDDDRHCESIDLRWTDKGEGVTVMITTPPKVKSE